MARSLSEKIIVLTGASSGIGAATALACARAGMDVVLSARREDRLKEVAGQVTDLGRRAAIVVGDVTDPGLSQRLLDAATEHFGGFDVVFANAGYGTEKSIVDMTDEELRRMFDVNFFAGVDLLRAAAHRLIAADRPGHLLMCSSCLAKFTLPDHGAYSATKAAQNHVCRAMRMELRPHGIDVASVHPVTTRTDFFNVSDSLSGKAAATGAVPDHAPRWMVQPPERVARAVVKCLQRPKPEVWTNLLVRLVAATMTAFPRFMDACTDRGSKRPPGSANA